VTHHGASGRTLVAMKRASDLFDGRLTRARDRLDASAAGHVRRRATQFEMTNRALVLAGLSLMLLIPALVALSAVLPLGKDHSLAASWARHMGLSGQAARAVRQLFAPDTARGTSTLLSSLVTIGFAYSWPAEIQRGYQRIWDLPSRGMRDGWRPLVWLGSLFVAIAGVASSGAVAGGPEGALLVGVVGSPVVFLWTWWTQHLFLGGRTAYRRLIPGAVATTAGLAGLSLFNSVYLSSSITQNFDKYGPIGVVFALLSWLIGFNVVMLGGPLAGHVWITRRE